MRGDDAGPSGEWIVSATGQTVALGMDYSPSATRTRHTLEDQTWT